MSNDKDFDKAAIKLAINEHLHLHGPKKWPLLMSKFPEMSRTTMWRIIKDVREDIERRAGEGGGADLRLVQKRIKSNMAPSRVTQNLKDNLPLAPSPAMVVDLGSGVADVFNFFENFNELVRDAKMMREHSTKTEEGTEKIKNPMMFDKAFGRRLELMETWLHSQDLVWNLEKMQELYFMVIEEVGKADADTQQAILSRIRTLNNKRGLTIDARLF
jgi:hypothetical protein